MNLFQSHKDKKKKNAEIIASVEEEDIVYEAAQENPPYVEEQPPVEEPAPVEEVVEEVTEEVVEETTEEVAEEVTEEVVEEASEEVVEETTEEVVEETTEEVVEEVAEEVVEETTEEVVEETTEEVVEETAEEVVEEVAEEVVEEVAEEAIAEAVVEDVAPVEEVVKEPVYQPTFAEKMNIADEDIQRRYDELKNYALRFKKLTWRISKKYDSINQGRFQFVKLSVAGKTLKLNLNMDISEADPKYHCVDKRKTKTYEDVPTQMRVKSDRGLKYAKELIDQCAEKHGLVENPKFKPVNSLELIAQHLELGDTDDIIFEVQEEDEE